uniref:MADF domain-containing protein n=1 Tax=Zeugodacus cucurbitae TaxID=28588 RepID=A0A0A1X1N9_ZEUCU
MSAALSPLHCDLRSYSRLWLGEFIELYQQEECLWHPKHPDYSNHSVRNKAYDRLVEKLKEVEPNPDRAMVVRKINSLRSAFRREFRKSSSKNNYETRLWYYDKLLFIAEQNPKRLAAMRDAKTAKRPLTISFDVDDSMEFDEEPVVEATTVSPSENHNQATEIKTMTVTAGECVIVKDEEQHQHQHQHQHQTQIQHQHQHQHELQQQQHSTEQHMQHATTTTQPQHATEVKVLEITSLDTNSQREIQQAVNSLEQHQLHQQQLHQQQQQQQQASQYQHHPSPQQYQQQQRRSSSPMKESDRPSYPAHYRHSQTDLTEWEEHQQHNQFGSTAALHHAGGPRRGDVSDRYAYRNGSARENGGDWEEAERPRPRRPDGRYSDSASTVSTAVLNHYSGYHRRPINRSSNLLSATLCLVKELDYPSLEVVEHAVRCRIDELSAD